MWRTKTIARHLRVRASFRQEARPGSVRGGAALPWSLEGESDGGRSSSGPTWCRSSRARRAARLLSALGDLPLRRIYHVFCARIQGWDRSPVEAWPHTLLQALPKPGRPHTALAHWRPIQWWRLSESGLSWRPSGACQLGRFSPASSRRRSRASLPRHLPVEVASCDVAGVFRKLRLPYGAEALRQQCVHPAHVASVLQDRMFARTTPRLGVIDIPEIQLRRGRGAPRTPSLCVTDC